MRDLTGEEIGPYKIVGKLGRGGMADVYKAFHIDLEINRAIKVIRPEFVGADDFKARFQREAKAVASLQHPNIVQIHDFGSHEGSFYMVMEFVDGHDLKKTMKTKGALRPISDAIDIVEKIALALNFAHNKDLLHRDIKPENIMLRPDGSPVLMDFGIAKLLTADTQLTQTGVGIGTPSYMSPEQAQADSKLGPASDLYSLTVVLYEMLTGQVPYSADTPIAVMLKVISDPLPLPRQLSPDISESLQQFLIKGTAKDPERRHLNGEEYARALQALTSEPNQEALSATLIVEPQAFNTADHAETKKAGTPWLVKFLALLAGVALLAVLYALLPDTKTELAVDSKVDSSPSEQVHTTSSDRQAASPQQTETSESGSSVILEHRGASAKDDPVTKNLQLNKGDVLFMNVHSASATTDFILQKEDGRKPVFSSYRNYGPHTVGSAGKYQFIIRPRKGDADIDVELWRLSPAVIEEGALEKNGVTSGSTLAPGQIARYTAELSAGDTVFFNLLKISSTSDFSVVLPDGRNVLHNPTYRDHGPMSVEKSGLYTVLVDPRDDATVDYEFTLNVYSPQTIESGTAEFGKWYQLQNKYPGQTFLYDLDVGKGSAIYLEIGDVSSTTDFIIESQNSREPLSNTYQDPGKVIEIPNDQHYQLSVDPRGDNLSEFEFRLHLLEKVVLQGGTVSMNQFVTGSTAQPGQSIHYSFAGEKDTELQFDLSKTSVTTDFKITSPDGRTELLNTYTKGRKDIVLPESGTYEIVVDPRNAKLADFEFRLLGVK